MYPSAPWHRRSVAGGTSPSAVCNPCCVRGPSVGEGHIVSPPAGSSGGDGLSSRPLFHVEQWGGVSHAVGSPALTVGFSLTHVPIPSAPARKTGIGFVRSCAKPLSKTP